MSTSAPQSQSFHASDDQTSTVVGISCMVIVLCSAAVGGRFLARWIVKARIEADDYATLAALFVIVGLAIEQFCLAHYGIGRDPTNVTLSNTRAIAKVQLASQITYVTAISLAKASILMLYRRIFSLRVLWFRICWWAYAGLVMSYFTVLLIFLLVQCLPHPISALWEDKRSCNPAVLGAQIVGIVNIVMDIIILVMPLPMVWVLRMSKKQKFAVSGVFLLGLIGCAVSTARVIHIPNSKIFNPRGVSFIIWSVVEPAVALVCACLPALRPIVRGVRKLATSQSRSRSRSRSHRSQSQTRHWKPTQEEEGQPIRMDSPLQLLKDNTSTQICSQEEIHQSYPMDDMQPLRPLVRPDRTSSRTLDVGPPAPRKDRSAAGLV